MAESWWGSGARPPEWILARGGSIIRYKISGSGADGRYKAVLTKGGKYIEGEIGKSGMFDDPKDGTYVVTAMKGGTDTRTPKKGKKIASITVTTHPGETIRVFFDEASGKATMQSDRKAAPRPAPEPVVPAPQIQNQPAPKPAETMPSNPIPESPAQVTSSHIEAMIKEGPNAICQISTNEREEDFNSLFRLPDFSENIPMSRILKQEEGL